MRPEASSPSWARWALLLGGGFVLAVHVARFPPVGEPPFPEGIGWPQAAKLAVVAHTLLAWAAIQLAAFGLGGFAARFGAPGRATVRLGVGFVLLADLVLLLAAVHRLDTPSLLAVLGVSAAAGLVSLRGGGRAVSAAVRGASPRHVAWTAAVAVVLAGPVLGAWVPDYGWDAFVYHLALPERWLRADAIVIPRWSALSAFPATMEMLYLLGLALDSGAVAKLLHVEMGVLAMVVAARLSGRVSPRAGLLAALVLLADPLFVWELGVAYSDLLAMLFALLALDAVVEARAGAGSAVWRAGLFAGACVATRYTAASVAIGTLVVLSIPRPGERVGVAVRRGLVAGVVALAVFSPWLARNAAFTGNPVSPALQGVFHAPGTEYFDPVAIEQNLSHVSSFGLGRGVPALLAIPWNLTMARFPNGRPRFAFQVGCLYLIGVALALAVGGVRRRTEARVALGMAACATLIWFASGAQESRYLLPALGLLSVPAGLALDAVLPRNRSRWLGLWAVPLLALAVAQWKPLRLLPYRYGYALGELSVEAFESQEPALVAARRLRPLLGPTDRVLLLFEARGYLFRGLDYVPQQPADGSPLLLALHRAASRGGLRRWMEDLGVTHVLLNTNTVVSFPPTFVAGYTADDLREDLNRLHAFLERDTTLVLAERGVIVRRLRQDSGAGTGG